MYNGSFCVAAIAARRAVLSGATGVVPVASINVLTSAPRFTATPAFTVVPDGSIASATSLGNGLPELIAGLPAFSV